MTDQIKPELVERMESWMRDVLSGGALSTRQDKLWAQGRAIVAELTAPVDPDLLEARRIYADDTLKQKPSIFSGLNVSAIMGGDYDDYLGVRVALSAIKATRLQYTEGRA